MVRRQFDLSELAPSNITPRVVDDVELARWFAEARSDEWICQEYERRYNITTSPALWRHLRRVRRYLPPGGADGDAVPKDAVPKDAAPRAGSRPDRWHPTEGWAREREAPREDEPLPRRRVWTPASFRRVFVDRGAEQLSRLFPWEVAPEHRWAEQALMLRLEARRRAGETLVPAELTNLVRWVQVLNDRDLVVHYDPAVPGGFLYVPRRPGIDLDLIRDPAR